MNDYLVKLRFTGTAEFIVIDSTTVGALNAAKLQLEKLLLDVPGVRLEWVHEASARKEEI